MTAEVRRGRGVCDYRKVGILGGVVLGVVLSLLAVVVPRCRGGGAFNQPVTVVSSRPVCQVRYENATLDEQTRLLLLKYKAPAILEVSPKAAEFDGSGFPASVMYTTDQCGILPAKVYHRPHLVVFVDFADGTFDVRIADIPPGMGKTPIVLHFD